MALRAVLLAVVGLCLRAAGDAGFAAHVTEHWITQPLDHGRPALGSFAQRYLALGRPHGRADGPAVVFLAGERGVLATDLTDTFAGELAERLHGAAYALEQRFYGVSVPASPNGTLAHLRVWQTLRDVRRFCESIPASGWVLVGASLGGSLAAWTKHVWRDPRVFVVAEGAPMRVPWAYWRYDVAAAERLPCAAGVARGVAAVDRAVEAGGVVAEEVRRRFAWPAGGGGGAADDAGFVAGVAAPVAAAVQRGDARGLCARWSAAGGARDPVGALAAVASSPVWPGSRACPPLRAWLWQQCGELGLWQTTPPRSSPFFARRLRSRLLTPLHYTALCRRCLKPTQPPAAWRPLFLRFAHEAAEYLADRRDVVFLVGGDDPWRYVAVAEGARARVDVAGVGHGWVVRGLVEGDEAVAAAREAVVDRVLAWLQDVRPSRGGTSAVVRIAYRQAYALAVLAAALAIYALCRVFAAG
ncbi:hypothetical protein GGI15_003346 [Coemansia interrupta]|uniref:Serine aminopeptidase S33 domain-containing protein n=1 Tax=Coemansia interrupta TaxID=1126814 RepID=A0A9W8H7W0_9FUNG|nr:hypothetical protein GGI15_003346 [Coemansia interrupta]